MSTDLSLNGRTALIAGASSGLGAHFAKLYAGAGAKVVLGARRIDRTQALSDEIKAQAAEIKQLKVQATTSSHSDSDPNPNGVGMV